MAVYKLQIVDENGNVVQQDDITPIEQVNVEVSQTTGEASGSASYGDGVLDIHLQGIKGEKGEGYSKKEAQQMASKLTLQRLRKEPQFIDAIFAAKTERTKMEEEPVSVPEEEPLTSEPPSNSPSLGGESKVGKSSLSKEALGGSPKQGELEEVSIDLSLDDITVTPKEQSREDIIAAAEAAAFAEEE